MLAGDGDDGGGGGGGGFGGGQSLMRALEDRLDAAGFAAVRGLGGPGLLGMQPGAGGRSGGGLPDEAARRDRSFLASHPAVKSILVWGLVCECPCKPLSSPFSLLPSPPITTWRRRRVVVEEVSMVMIRACPSGHVHHSQQDFF